jgi:hypothetical protein
MVAGAQLMRPPLAWTQLCWQWWDMPEPVSSRLYRAITTAHYQRPGDFRRYINFCRTDPLKVDADHFIDEVLAPQRLVEIVEDLVHEGKLSRRDGSRIEDYWLCCVDQHGHWKQENAHA